MRRELNVIVARVGWLCKAEPSVGAIVELLAQELGATMVDQRFLTGIAIAYIELYEECDTTTQDLEYLLVHALRAVGY